LSERGRWSWLLLVALSSATPVACDGTQQAAERSDADRVAHAVRLLREAPNDAKRPLLRALEGVECTSPRACEVRERCLEGYGSYLEALDAIATARRALARDGGAAADERTALLLAVAQRKLKQAEVAVERCTVLSAALVRKSR
jgi:hypothetical protein